MGSTEKRSAELHKHINRYNYTDDLKPLIPKVCGDARPVKLESIVGKHIQTTHMVWKLERWLTGQGFCFLCVGDRDHSVYSHSKISEMVTLTDNRHTLNIVVLNTEATFTPIFKFHSTVVMNFVR